MSDSKICGKCKVLKPAHEFYKRSASKDGLCAKCKACSSDYLKQYIETNKDKVSERQKNYYEQNREKIKNYCSERYKQNKDVYSQKAKNYYQKNREQILTKRTENKEIYNKRSSDYYHNNKEKCAATRKEWAKKNRPRLTAKQNYRYTSQKKRTPLWLTPEDLQKISDVYQKAAALTSETGVLHHVDHIIPLQGKTVSGLHVPQNLQVLNHIENIRKKNKYDEWGSDA